MPADLNCIRKSRFWRVLALRSAAGFAVVLCALPVLWAQEAKPSEYQVKAAYLYNFGKFVTWPRDSPEGDDHTFTICVLGKDPFGALLDSTLLNQTIDGKSAVAKRIAKAQDATSCHVLFISSSEERQLKEILMGLNNVPVLTVSDIAQFSQRGGMIEFVTDDDKVRFEVNVSNAEHAGLNVSSELLKVAVTVRRNSRQPGDGE